MPAVIDATPGGPTANSFATIAWANTYHESVLDATIWDAATDDDKTRALITATRLIVEMFNRIGWAGWPVSSTQRLPVPRVGMTTVNGYPIASGVIPDELANATSELARRLLENGLPDAPSATAGVKSMKVGPVDFEFTTDSGNVEYTLDDAVFSMIAHLTPRGAMSRTVVPLQRG